MRDGRLGLVIPSAGKGTRLGSKQPKPYVLLRGVPLIIHTLRALSGPAAFAQKTVVADVDRVEAMSRLFKRHRIPGVQVIPGGAERADSVRAGVESLRTDIEWVMIHDAARPFVTVDQIAATWMAARKTGAAILAEPARATVKWSSVGGEHIKSTLDRKRVFLAQTPQVFRVDLLKKAYNRFGGRIGVFTDEAALLESTGVRVALAMGSSINFKITTPDDLVMARSFLAAGRMVGKKK